MDPGFRRGDEWAGGRHLQILRSRLMRHILLASALLLAGTIPARAQNPDKQSFEVIEHGHYMATAANCAACHTATGGQPINGGHGLHTPLGDLHAPNQTPRVYP